MGKSRLGPSSSSGDYEGEFHGERIVDGNAATPTALLLYKSGSATAFTLNSRFRLVITDIFITSESAGDVLLLADGAAAGEYLVSAGVAANAIIDRHLKTPYKCQPGQVPEFAGPGTHRSSCIVEGYIITR